MEEKDVVHVKKLIINTDMDCTLAERMVERKINECRDLFHVFKSDDKKLMLLINPPNGNNIILQSDNIEELGNILEKIQLNLEKCRLDKGKISIESNEGKRVHVDKRNQRFQTKSDASILRKELEKYNEIRKIYGLSERENVSHCAFGNIDVEDFKYQIMDELYGIDEEKFLSYEEERTVDILIDELVALNKKEDTYVISNIDDITIWGEKLEKTRDVANYLIEKSKIDDQIIDFNSVNYGDVIQDYLMKMVYSKEIKLSQYQKNAIGEYKGAGFRKYNAFMRGNFEVLNEEYIPKKSIKQLVRDLLQMEALANALPGRKYDIVLRRKGAGVNKNTEIGAKNIYDSYVSFGTNNGTAISGSNTLYKRILKKDEKAMPLELLCPEVLVDYFTECEILTLPFSYEVKDIKTQEKNNHSQIKIVTMENEEEKSVTEIVEKRLHQLKNLQEIKLKKIADKEVKCEKIGSEDEKVIFEDLGYKEKDLKEEQFELTDIIKLLEENGGIRALLKFDKRIAKDKMQYDSPFHGVNHTRRVAFLVRALANLGGLNNKDEEILLIAAQYHDIGREDDYEDNWHGAESADKLEKSGKLKFFPKESTDLIKFLMSQHSKSKTENEQAILELPEEKQERYKMMLDYMKDADKLDRVRLGKCDGLDVSRLSLPISKKMIKVAYQSYEYLFDMLEILEKNEVMNNLDEINETLQEVRQIKEKKLEEEIKIEELKYFDDEIEKESTNQDVIMSKIVEESKEKVKLSKIRKIVNFIKQKKQENDRKKTKGITRDSYGDSYGDR